MRFFICYHFNQVYEVQPHLNLDCVRVIFNWPQIGIVMLKKVVLQASLVRITRHWKKDIGQSRTMT